MAPPKIYFYLLWLFVIDWSNECLNCRFWAISLGFYKLFLELGSMYNYSSSFWWSSEVYLYFMRSLCSLFMYTRLSKDCMLFCSLFIYGISWFLSIIVRWNISFFSNSSYRDFFVKCYIILEVFYIIFCMKRLLVWLLILFIFGKLISDC